MEQLIETGLEGMAAAFTTMLNLAMRIERERRTRKIRVFPNQAALERLASAILVEIDEQWIATDRACLTMNHQDE